ncbi:NADP-dependent oxidoreductase [Methylocella sp. CPCC 101449]|uniref:NADP-dependent oxidoreductase n=1 Tax=Methylocella sp. CPCC 101449 TaxID=2987531 RepID=UPI002890FB8C|nr:NADP-dependent oxidoreductase [Methylocella sp. CPCC 101449]MDT2021091.1 NADP-dependent oxidoreductase [Methylocella sp. CPCC 101449]
MPQNKAFILASRPSREVPAGPHNFQLVEREAAAPGEGEVLVRHHYLSLDPYMRGRMNDGKSYAQPQPLGEVMIGGTVGEVVASRNPRFAVGDRVVGTGGWQLYGLSDGKGLRKIEPGTPIQAWLGPVGMPGVTAWYGVTQIIAPKAGETVLVSAATGAVGSVVGQLVKLAGARAVGIAGGPEKCAFAVSDLGYDACVDHRDVDFPARLKEAVPDGINGLFENVGGEPFRQAMRRLNPFSRIALCGLVSSGYDGTPTPLPDVRVLLDTRSRLEGFIVSDHLSVWPQALSELAGHVAAGRLRWRESVAEGLEAAPQAFFAMLKGGNFGKQLVKLI